jgi:phosphatidylserine decarboxylase
MLKYRDGRMIDQPNGQDRLLGLIYGSTLGRMLLRPLVSPFVSELAGKFLSSGISKLLIPSFIRRNKIDMAQFESTHYGSYNEFFSRKIKPRP